MTAGAPTKYRKEYVEKAKEYIETYEELGDKIPSIEGFADFIEVGRKTIYNWCKLNEDNKRIASEEFLHTLARLEARQGKILQNKGLDGTFNATITKLMLSANHGMREKSDITSDDKPIEGNTITFKNFKNGTVCK